MGTNKAKIKIKYYIERTYPYIFSFILILLYNFYEVNFLINDNLSNALNGVISFDAIVIGFLGAIMPVILSMKNESKLVKYVFENDKKDLFKKYLYITIKLGVLNVIFSLTLYLNSSFKSEVFICFVVNLWLFTLTSFMFSTMRSMGHMITLLFSKDVIENPIKPSDEGAVYTEDIRAQTRDDFSDEE